jgi:alpha-galactosidase
MAKDDLFDKKLGYNYILIDDCWQERGRNATGFLNADRRKFPDGMKAVVDYIHSIELRVGIYSSAGSKTCAGYPGSLGYEGQDALLYAEWGIDYVKYDNCYNEGVSAKERYKTMGEAINATGHQMFYAICNWGNDGVTEWAPEIANSWRTTVDIQIGN